MDPEEFDKNQFEMVGEDMVCQPTYTPGWIDQNKWLKSVTKGEDVGIGSTEVYFNTGTITDVDRISGCRLRVC